MEMREKWSQRIMKKEEESEGETNGVEAFTQPGRGNDAEKRNEGDV